MQRSSPEELEAFHTLTVKFFIDRKPHPRNMLQKIKCPIYLVHCGSDIAYEMKYVEELRDTLQGANLNVRVADIEGAPHFGCVTHPDQSVYLFYNLSTAEVLSGSTHSSTIGCWKTRIRLYLPQNRL